MLHEIQINEAQSVLKYYSPFLRLLNNVWDKNIGLLLFFILLFEPLCTSAHLCHLSAVAPAINTETPTASDVTGQNINFWPAVLIHLTEQLFWCKFLQAWRCLRQRWETKKRLHDWNLTGVEVCRIRTPNLSQSTDDKDASVMLTKSWFNALQPGQKYRLFTLSFSTKILLSS